MSDRIAIELQQRLKEEGVGDHLPRGLPKVVCGGLSGQLPLQRLHPLDQTDRLHSQPHTCRRVLEGLDFGDIILAQLLDRFDGELECGHRSRKLRLTFGLQYRRLGNRLL